MKRKGPRNGGSRGTGGNGKKSGVNGSYKVGWGKPPDHTKFKPGQSGYPSGRPKGSRNRIRPGREDNPLRAIIRDEANELITVTDAKGRKTKITSARGVVRAIKFNALKGQHRSQKLWVQLTGHEERLAREEQYEDFRYWAEYKRQMGPQFKEVNSPDHLPHPDDVILDINAGVVRFAGPITKDEVPVWKRWRLIRRVVRDELVLVVEQKDKSEFEDTRESTECLIDAGKVVLMFIEQALDGSRETMRVLERLDLPDFGKIEPPIKRLEKGLKLIFPYVYQALRQESKADRP